MQLVDPVKEGERIMAICNACRYCEGYCAVFPAMERRIAFPGADLNYMANLCHGCGECYYACQYAPPHEFAVNVPQTLAQIRRDSYAQHAWPAPLARAFARNGLLVSVLLALALLVALALGTRLYGAALFEADPIGDFYRFIPHGVMAGVFGAVGLFVLVALLAGFVRFWRDSGESLAEFAQPFALWEAIRDMLALKYLDGGGVGCTYPDADQSMARKWFHHLTFYGFMLCFAATLAGTVYHYGFGWKAPYGYFSLPVLLGTAGGIGLVIGPLGLLWLKLRADAQTQDASQFGMDTAFIALLMLSSLTGLALLAWRQTAWMGWLLIVHLAVVMTLFVLLPYGKFVHGVYRGAALVKYALERRRPGLNLGGE